MQDTIIELKYKSFGQGDAVIILHGLFGMLDNWMAFAKDLAEDYQVFLVDLRNHGRSPRSDVMDYPAMARDLLKFMDDHWIFHANIIGHSMGGKVAMEFAREHADRLEKMIIVDIAPKTYEGSHKIIFDTLKSLDLKSTNSRSDLDMEVSKNIPDFSVRQFLMKNLKRRKSGGFEFKMNLPVLKRNYKKLLSGLNFDETIATDSLFVKGERSPYISEDDYLDILEWFPLAKFETIPNAGHWVHADQKDQLLEVTRRFLAL